MSITALSEFCLSSKLLILWVVLRTLELVVGIRSEGGLRDSGLFKGTR